MLETIVRHGNATCHRCKACEAAHRWLSYGWQNITIRRSKKLSLGLSTDRTTLQVVTHDSHYILKPQTETYPQLPENEHLTMRLAALFGLEVPLCGLLRLKDESIAYIVKRFGRPRRGVKRAQEDFCQLAEKPAKDKYNGSAELCIRILRQYSTETRIDAAKLYQQLVFSWWVGHGDLHLKNLSLTMSSSGFVSLTPAYDLLNTNLYIPDDALALTVGGKRNTLTKEVWLDLAAYADIPVQAARKILAHPAAMMVKARQAIHASYLSADLALDYQRVLEERAAVLV